MKKEFKFSFLNFKIQSVRGFLDGENDLLDTTIADHYIDDAKKRLRESFEYYMEKPKQHLQTYVEKYSYLVDGTANKEIDQFISENKSFDEFVMVLF